MSDASGNSGWQQRSTISGSFRGVDFFYDSVEGEIGRRTVLKEFPGRDQPFSEDLGLRTRRFTLEMFVIGSDYDADRDALRQAFEMPGPGTLWHPYWGSMEVTVDGPVRVRETPKNGGMARFTVTFVEAGATLQLVSPPSPKLQVIKAADLAITVEVSQFAAALAVVGAISAVVDSAVNALNEVAHQINRVRGKIAAAIQVINDAKAAIDSIVANAVDLLQTPQKLAAALTGIYSSVISGINSISSAVQALKDFFGDEDTVPSAGSALASQTKVDLLTNVVTDLSATGATLPTTSDVTPTESQIAENQRQIIRLAAVCTVANTCKIAAELKYENTSQTTKVRHAITGMLDTLISDPTLGDELYSVLADLRAALVDFLEQAALTLPEIVDFVPNSTIPALVLAYQLYGDSTRESEILIRNSQLRDPTAVPGGQAIKVINDA